MQHCHHHHHHHPHSTSLILGHCTAFSSLVNQCKPGKTKSPAMHYICWHVYHKERSESCCHCHLLLLSFTQITWIPIDILHQSKESSGKKYLTYVIPFIQDGTTIWSKAKVKLKVVHLKELPQPSAIQDMENGAVYSSTLIGNTNSTCQPFLNWLLNQSQHIASRLSLF